MESIRTYGESLEVPPFYSNVFSVGLYNVVIVRQSQAELTHQSIFQKSLSDHMLRDHSAYWCWVTVDTAFNSRTCININTDTAFNSTGIN